MRAGLAAGAALATAGLLGWGGARALVKRIESNPDPFTREQLLAEPQGEEVRISRPDGTVLRALGNPDGPTVVLVHGWPDSHVLWDGVVPGLADRFRIIRYDNRGVGKSSAPKPISAYKIARLADDLAAVIAAVARPGEPVHLLGHDWGSVATWEYLSRPGASVPVASFTSVSGPSSAIYWGYLVESLKRPH